MKAIKVIAVSAAGLSAMVAVVAGGPMGSVAVESELKADAVADANGNLHVPDAYRTTYQFLGTWAVVCTENLSTAIVVMKSAQDGA
jgi:hypothetical protein